MKLIAMIYALFILQLNAGEVIQAGDFQFKAGAPWVQKEAGGMVKGALAYGETDLVVKFYHFGAGQGGGVAANVKRWKGQFQGESVSEQQEKKHGDQTVTIIKVKGTYLDGPPMGKKVPRENYALYGAIIPHASGDVFLKMTGSEPEMKKAEEDFRKLVASAFMAAEAK